MAAIADMHGGHALGLLNPDTILIRQLDDHGEQEEWTPDPTRTQERLWPLYLSLIDKTVQYADGCEIIVFEVGDPVQGSRYTDGLIRGVDDEDQRIIAFWNLKPLIGLPNVKIGRLFTGTPVHVSPGYADARVASMLDNEFPDRNVRAVHHTRSRIGEDTILDTSHHGPHPGSRDWLRGNVARYYLRDRIYRDRRSNKRPADAYIRAHRHVWVHETINDVWWFRRSTHHLTVIPSICGFTSYARYATQSEPELVNGMMLYEIIEGKLTNVESLIDFTDLRLEEEL